MSKAVRYEYSIITYLDVLGFRELIQTKTPGEISRIIRFLRESAKPHKEVAKIHRIKCLNFSDTTIRITPVYTDVNIRHRVGVFFSEVLSLVHLQAELAVRKIILRGGLSIGDIVTSWRVTYGPGLVQAYELEQNASVPRIIIDPRSLNALRQNELLRAHDYEYERKAILSMLRKDEADRHWFVDYLGTIDQEMEYPDEGYPKYLEDHGDMIAEGLRRYRMDKRVLDKFRWLRRYHNSTVLAKYGRDRGKSLLV